MRVLFSSLPGHGHTYPLVPLAVAVRAAGHEVRFATDAQLHPVIERFGLPTERVGLPLAEAFSDPSLGGAPMGPGSRPDPAAMQARAGRVFGEIIPRRVLADLTPVVTAFRPDLMVVEIMNVGAELAARAAGVAQLGHSFGRVGAGMGLWLGRGVARLSAELGLSAVPADVPVVDICPPSLVDPEFAARTDRVPLRPAALRVPGEGPSPLLRGERPLVYLTLGTAFSALDVLRAAIDGLAALDAEVLVAAGPRLAAADLASAHANVRVESWVPQAAVLEEASLVVHHGGSGTMLGCAAAGVPQLVLPQGADQFSNAAAVAGSGCATVLLPGHTDPASVRDAARTLFADADVRRAASALAAEIAAMPSAGEVASRLPELALA